MNLAVPDRHVSSQQVRWFDFHLWCARWLDTVDHFPLAGTTAWFALPDDDPKKKTAVLFAASCHVQRMEAAQEAECEASHAVSAGAPWGQIAQRVQSRREFESEHPWAKRRVS